MPKLIGTPSLNTEHPILSGGVLAAWCWNPLTGDIRNVVGGSDLSITGSSGPTATDHGNAYVFDGDNAQIDWPDTESAHTGVFFTPYFSDVDAFTSVIVGRASDNSFNSSMRVRNRSGQSRLEINDNLTSGSDTAAVDVGEGEAAMFAAAFNARFLDDQGPLWAISDTDTTPVRSSDPGEGEENQPTDHIRISQNATGNLTAFGYLIFFSGTPTSAQLESLFADPLAIIGETPTLESIRADDGADSFFIDMGMAVSGISDTDMSITKNGGAVSTFSYDAAAEGGGIRVTLTADTLDVGDTWRVTMAADKVYGTTGGIGNEAFTSEVVEIGGNRNRTRDRGR